MLGAIQHLVAVVPLFFSQNNIIVWLSILWVIAVFVETIVKVLKISSVASLLVKRLIKLHLGLIPKLFS